MEDFKTMWSKMLSMPGEDRLSKMDAFMETLTPEEGRAFLQMIQTEPSPEADMVEMEKQLNAQ